MQYVHNRIPVFACVKLASRGCAFGQAALSLAWVCVRYNSKGTLLVLRCFPAVELIHCLTHTTLTYHPVHSKCFHDKYVPLRATIMHMFMVLHIQAWCPMTCYESKAGAIGKKKLSGDMSLSSWQKQTGSKE